MRAVHALSSSTRHLIGVGLQALLIAAIVAALAFAAATLSGGAPGGAKSVFAAKGGHGNVTLGASSINLDQAGENLSLGSTVTFTFAAVGLAANEIALVDLKCMEGDSVVYRQLASPDTAFVLGGGSSAWWGVGGTASCVAYLKAYSTHGPDTIRTLASSEPFSAN
jgi:hypothetical protein